MKVLIGGSYTKQSSATSDSIGSINIQWNYNVIVVVVTGDCNSGDNGIFDRLNFDGGTGQIFTLAISSKYSELSDVNVCLYYLLDTSPNWPGDGFKTLYYRTYNNNSPTNGLNVAVISLCNVDTSSPIIDSQSSYNSSSWETSLAGIVSDDIIIAVAYGNNAVPTADRSLYFGWNYNAAGIACVTSQNATQITITNGTPVAVAFKHNLLPTDSPYFSVFTFEHSTDIDDYYCSNNNGVGCCSITSDDKYQGDQSLKMHLDIDSVSPSWLRLSRANQTVFSGKMTVVALHLCVTDFISASEYYDEEWVPLIYPINGDLAYTYSPWYLSFSNCNQTIRFISQVSIDDEGYPGYSYEFNYNTEQYYKIYVLHYSVKEEGYWLTSLYIDGIKVWEFESTEYIPPFDNSDDWLSNFDNPNSLFVGLLYTMTNSFNILECSIDGITLVVSGYDNTTPVFSNDTFFTLEAGKYVEIQLVVSENVYKYSSIQVLPDGLVLDDDTGLISGTPT